MKASVRMAAVWHTAEGRFVADFEGKTDLLL